MKFWKHALVVVAAALAGLPHPGITQSLDPTAIEHPVPDSWPTYHGDYSGRRHSALTQITTQNVGYLTLSWAFQTNQNAEIKSTPLMVDLAVKEPDRSRRMRSKIGVSLKLPPMS